MSDDRKLSAGQRRKQRSIEHRTCRHFNGIQNERCDAGMAYNSFRTGAMMQLPCLLIHPQKPQATCDKFAARTQEELDAEERETDALLDRVRIVMPAVAAWRKKPPRGKRGVIECPACKGRLHLTQAASNGHVSGKCETAGCVSWIE